MHLPRITRGVGLLLALTVVFLVLGGLRLAPTTGLRAADQTSAVYAAQPPALAGGKSVQVRHPDMIAPAVKSDTSPPLSSLRPLRYGVFKDDHDNPAIRNLKAAGNIVDSVVQRALSPLVMPAPIQNFDGSYNQNGPLPPDTNGAVGRNHYVQIVNSTFQVFSKTGTSLYGPANNNTIFTGFGGVCEARNDGDPIALYDGLADRWVLTWFTSSAPYMECIAVSTTADPTGAWYRYAFNDSNPGTTLGDYPKMSVWPDAYYMTTNEFGGSSGDGNYAYDRAKMLRGDPTAQEVYFHGPDGGKLPSDLENGSPPPPAGSPNYIVEWYDTSHLAEFKFHVDFVTPGNSTYTGPFLITVASFDPNAPSVPEPGTTTLLDNLSDRLMFRLTYHNFPGDHEALTLNHTVNVSGVDGIRWYELRDPNNGAGASVFQQGTYAPADGVYRWMGSMAMDHAGNIALGFSAGNATVFPGIRYAGRLVTDPLGQLSQGEATLLAGTGSEDYPAAHRWGDYSDLTVDPADGCTFWYTTLYWGQTGERNWRTRIGSFKFPSCSTLGTPTPASSPTGGTPTATPVVPTGTPCAGAVSFTGAITNTDPTQTGRLGLGGLVSSCAVPKSVAALSDSLTRHYRSYTYTNSTANAQCVTVRVTQSCGDNAVQSIAYLGSFNPANPQANYLADGGAAGPTFSYSFSLPAGQTAVVVVPEVSPNIGCALYTLTINPCAAPVQSTPTATGTPSATPTPAQPTATPNCGGPGVWQAGPTLDPARYAGEGAIGSDGKFYVTGGQNPQNTPFPNANRFNPTTNAWETLAPLPIAASQLAVAASGGKVFVAGGYLGGTAITSTLQIYDIASNTWSFGASLPASLEAAAGVALNGKFYVVGGDDFSTTSLRTTYIYDIAGNSWTTGPQIPDTGGRTNTYGTATNGLVYVWGGAAYNGTTNTAIDTLLVYDPAVATWTNLGSANTAGLGNYGTVSPYGTGKLLLTDGGNGGFVPVASTHLYDLVSHTFSAGPDLIVTRLGEAQATLPDGRVIVYAGQNVGGINPTVTNTSELLPPPVPCATVTPTATATGTATATATRTAIPPSATATSIPPSATAVPPTATGIPATSTSVAATRTPVGPSATPVAATNTPGAPTVTSTPCAITFSDVNPPDYFYTPVQYLYCHGVISGYADGTFRPYNNTTRSQMVKIVVLGFNKPIQTPSGGGYTFTDVPPANPFFSVIETAAALNIVSGYNCGGPGEPCDANNRPYFRPFANVTRGQLSKIDVAAANWLLQNPATRTFEDVLPNTAFYPFVETAAAHGVISGYTCGGPGEPCGSGNRPYFRQNNEATRGQIAKIVYLSIVNGLNGHASGVTP